MTSVSGSGGAGLPRPSSPCSDGSDVDTPVIAKNEAIQGNTLDTATSLRSAQHDGKPGRGAIGGVR